MVKPLEAVRSKIQELEKEAQSRKRSGNMELYTTLLKSLAALREKEVLLMKEAAGGAPPVVQPPGKVSWLAHVSEAITRLMHGDECIGTICRIRMDGIYATARHCILEDGACLDGLTAFGEPLSFIAAFQDLDLALFRGRAGTALALAVGVWVALSPGIPVQLASYPRAIDSEFGDSTAGLSLTRGQITSCAATGCVASADYTLCMPNSSGGGVLLQESGRLAGLHIGIAYHEDNNTELSTPCSNNSGQQDMESNKKRLKKSPKSKAVNDSEAAQRSFSNIGHKAYSGLFIPALAIAACMVQAGVSHEDAMAQEAKVVARRTAGPRKYQGQSSKTQGQRQRHGIMLKGVPEATGTHTRFDEE